MILANRSEHSSENKIISDRLNEKISIDNQESNYKIYENIKLLNLDGQVIASSDNDHIEFLKYSSIEEFQKSKITLSDVYYDHLIDEDVFDVGVLVTDAKGQSIGFIHALVNFQDIIMLVEESKEFSQFTSSEFDLFDDDGFLIYSTADRREDYVISDFVFGFEEVHHDIEEELDEQYDKTIQEYGYTEPELSEAQWEEIEQRFLPLDLQYEEILQEYEFGEISENQERYLEKQMLELDSQYDEILREYGFVVPILSEENQFEFDEKIIEIESKYDEIYEQYDLDYTFGEKGFSIVESDDESEVLHSFPGREDTRILKDLTGFWLYIQN